MSKIVVDFFKYLVTNKMEDKIGEISLCDFQSIKGFTKVAILKITLIEMNHEKCILY